MLYVVCCCVVSLTVGKGTQCRVTSLGIPPKGSQRAPNAVEPSVCATSQRCSPTHKDYMPLPYRPPKGVQHGAACPPTLARRGGPRRAGGGARHLASPHRPAVRAEGEQGQSIKKGVMPLIPMRATRRCRPRRVIPQSGSPYGTSRQSGALRPRTSRQFGSLPGTSCPQAGARVRTWAAHHPAAVRHPWPSRGGARRSPHCRPPRRVRQRGMAATGSCSAGKGRGVSATSVRGGHACPRP